MRTPTFGDLVGDEDVFLTEYAGRRALYRPRALADHVRDLLSISELAQLIGTETFPFTYLRLVRQGKSVPASAFGRRVVRPGQPMATTVEAEKVYELVGKGATLAATLSTICCGGCGRSPTLSGAERTRTSRRG